MEASRQLAETSPNVEAGAAPPQQQARAFPLRDLETRANEGSGEPQAGAPPQEEYNLSTAEGRHGRLRYLVEEFLAGKSDKPLTLQNLGDAIGVTKERVYQLLHENGLHKTLKARNTEIRYKKERQSYARYTVMREAAQKRKQERHAEAMAKPKNPPYISKRKDNLSAVDERVPPWVSVTTRNRVYTLAQSAMVEFLHLSDHARRWSEEYQRLFMEEFQAAERRGGPSARRSRSEYCIASDNYVFTVLREPNLICAVRKAGGKAPRSEE